MIITSGITTFTGYLFKAFPLFLVTSLLLLGFWSVFIRDKNSCKETKQLAVDLLYSRYRNIHVRFDMLVPLCVVMVCMFLAWSVVPQQFVLSVRYDEEQNKWVSDLSKNIFTFYYTPNTENAYYAVHYMLEKVTADPNLDHKDLNYDINGEGDFEESGTHIEGIADVNKTVKIVPQTFPGFTLAESFAGNTPQVHRSVEYYVEYDSNGNTVDTDDSTVDEVLIDGAENDYFEIKITNGGTELYIFYLRNEYNYEIRHLEYLTNKELINPDTDQPYSTGGKALYGATITGNAEKIKGYTLVNAQTSYDMVIRAEADNSNLVYNIITFYYSPTQYVVDYVNTTPDWGSLDNSKDVIASTGMLKGSRPIVEDFSRFAGWYRDEDCTIPVTAEDGTVDLLTNKFTPDKDKLSDTQANVLYAKFELLAADFTINREGAYEEDQMFVYKVENTATNEVIYVTIQGNGSVTIKDLPFGTYTVTQQNGWSWRYSDEAHEDVAFKEPEGKTVHFGKVADTQKWLNGNSQPKINKRSG